MIIYTVGHSNRGIEKFIEILRSYDVSLVIDVRRFPVSTKYPHFNKENLSKSLEEAGIKYVWLGDLLGGFRRGGYLKYMESEEFKEGLEKLIELSVKNRVAVMCKEWTVFKCHRWYISDELVKRGHRVIHIIDEKRSQMHEELARVRRRN